MDILEIQTALKKAHENLPKSTVPVRVVDENGDLYDIKNVKFSMLNGGEIHIEMAEWDDE